MKALIKEICFSEKWLKDKAIEFNADPLLLEKTVYAFALLGYLVQLEENFIFKGGTSLLLHISTIKRLSIDIDIIFGGNIDKFISKIAAIKVNTPFIEFEENKRENRGLPKRRHFKFYYDSSISNKKEYVLLDIVLDNIDYLSFTENKLIKNPLIETDIDLSVTIPSVEGLIGDKLTAFAPDTIGVPFKTNQGNLMTMQVVKQLYDIGELFDIATDFKAIEYAYNATFERENIYRGKKFTKEEVLKNTVNTCMELLQIRLKGYKNSLTADFLEDGIKRIRSHLLNDRFTTDGKAKITASKVFCIANRLLKSSFFDFNLERYDESKINKIRDINLSEPYKRLNRLKPILPEAFYYVWLGVNK